MVKPARAARLLERAIDESPDGGWELALMGGQVERARKLVTRAADPELARLVVQAWSGDAAALLRLQDGR